MCTPRSERNTIGYPPSNVMYGSIEPPSILDGPFLVEKVAADGVSPKSPNAVGEEKPTRRDSNIGAPQFRSA